MSMSIMQSDLTGLAREYQFPVSGVISLKRLFSSLETAPGWPGAAKTQAKQLLHAAAAVLCPGYALQEKDGCLLICGLSCYRRDESASGSGQLPGAESAGQVSSGLFASFARRNYYAEAVARLKKISAELSGMLHIKSNTTRIFCNSRLPEKLLAYLAGIGFYGRNSLIINPLLGSDFITGGIYLPVELKAAVPPVLATAGCCASCTRCRDACPAGAIRGYAVVDGSRCFQALAPNCDLLTEHSMLQWGARIYGCQECQDACPCNRALTSETDTALGLLGSKIPLAYILAKNDTELEECFKKTVLDRKWIKVGALRRNAIISAGNSRDRALLPLLEKNLEAADAVIRETARWAIKRILS